jgi:hypothetical protein
LTKLRILFLEIRIFDVELFSFNNKNGKIVKLWCFYEKKLKNRSTTSQFKRSDDL